MIEVYVAGAIIIIGLIGFFGPSAWMWAAMISQMSGWLRDDLRDWFRKWLN